MVLTGADGEAIVEIDDCAMRNFELQPAAAMASSKLVTGTSVAHVDVAGGV